MQIKPCKNSISFSERIPNGCTFKGLYELLSSARSEKNLLGPNFKVHHGVLKYISETVIDCNNLYVIPDLEKQK